MFRLDRDGAAGTYRLVDRDRRVTFEVAGLVMMSKARLAILNWDGRQIPLEYESDHRMDPVSGEPYALHWFYSFGSSFEVMQKTGVGLYSFEDAQERARAQLLAVEAVLVNNFKYGTGEWKVDTARFFAEGHEWRASDFGYRTSGDIAET